MREESSNSQNVNYTITSCQRGTSQGSYRIHFGDGSSFFISIDFFLIHGLKKGLTVNVDLYQLIIDESKYVETYIKAISLLRRQLYSCFNLKRKLLTQEYDPSAINRVMSELQDKGYIDDYTYAENWVISRLKTKLDSYTTLLAGLLNKGISSDIAKKILTNQYSEEIESEIIKKSIDKCCRVGKSSDKIIKTLLRKGFNRNKVYSFVNNIGSIDEGY